MRSKKELISNGSSLKICLVTEGKADIYPRLGHTMEWDTGAAHAVVREADKEIYSYEQIEVNNYTYIKYNKENLLDQWLVVKGWL